MARPRVTGIAGAPRLIVSQTSPRMPRGAADGGLPQSELESKLDWVSIPHDEDLSMSKPRRHFSAPQKAEIVRRHLSGKEPVSDLADEFHLQPTQIHAWVKQVLDR